MVGPARERKRSRVAEDKAEHKETEREPRKMRLRDQREARPEPMLRNRVAVRHQRRFRNNRDRILQPFGS